MRTLTLKKYVGRGVFLSGAGSFGGRFCIADGSAYETKIGTYIDLILTNGTVIPCVLADQKADVHTDKNNQLTKHDGSLVEFVVDSKNLSKNVKKHGDVSFACKSWNSQIEKIRIYENWKIERWKEVTRY